MRERAVRKAMRNLEIVNPDTIRWIGDDSGFMSNEFDQVEFRITHGMKDVTNEELSEAGCRLVAAYISKRSKDDEFYALIPTKITFENKDFN